MTITGEQVTLTLGLLAVLGVVWRAARWAASVDARLAVIEAAVVPLPRARSEPPGGA